MYRFESERLLEVPLSHCYSIRLIIAPRTRRPTWPFSCALILPALTVSDSMSRECEGMSGVGCLPPCGNRVKFNAVLVYPSRIRSRAVCSMTAASMLPSDPSADVINRSARSFSSYQICFQPRKYKPNCGRWGPVDLLYMRLKSQARLCVKVSSLPNRVAVIWIFLNSGHR